MRLDLHWALLTEARYAWSEPETRSLWQRATPITLAGERALGLAPEDLVLHLATHFAVHHSLTGLLRQWDLALVLAQTPLDWPLLLARAEAWRVRRALFFALRGVAASLSTRGAAGRAGRLAASAAARAALLAGLLQRGTADRAAATGARGHAVADRPRPRRRRLGARCALWPSADWLRARYGSRVGGAPRALPGPPATPGRRAGLDRLARLR